ncbi:MAG: DUF3387 domain-containing protein [Candidatus ainarchaeum sp.]|nr:DUF3387 domain-containing protein [Candidatus ainarchaeum sp.]MDD4662365.1 DUF3387 domain-containing protein [Candidatus ainarchaeum sp.]
MEKRNNFNIQKITGVFLIFSLVLIFTLQTSFVNAQEGEVIKSNPLLKEDFLKINKIINKPFLERTSFNPEDQRSNYVQGEILVKYKDEKININSSKGENNANILNNNYSLKTISRFKENNLSLLKIEDNKTVEVIEELLKIAKEIKASEKKGEELDLSEDEVAFYDALSNNKSALDVLGDKQIVVIAKVLTDTIKKNTTSVDWEIRETERAKIRVLVKRILSKYGYPPDMQAEAVKLVLEQAERICKDGIEE